LTAPSPLANARGSIAPYNIDVLGFHPPAEAPDKELDLIDGLLSDMQSSLHTFVLLKRASRESDSKDTKKKQATLWKKYECKRQGDGISKVPFGRAFDSLLQRCDE
jgi:hypothetical protein